MIWKKNWKKNFLKKNIFFQKFFLGKNNISSSLVFTAITYLGGVVLHVENGTGVALEYLESVGRLHFHHFKRALLGPDGHERLVPVQPRTRGGRVEPHQQPVSLPRRVGVQLHLGEETNKTLKLFLTRTFSGPMNWHILYIYFQIIFLFIYKFIYIIKIKNYNK